MNKPAERHCAKAKAYIAKGDVFYRKAKPEIEAAIAEGASTREVARYLARSHTWVQTVRDWDGEGTLYGKDTERRQIDQAKQVLREAPLEQIEQVFESIPEERRQAVLAAAGEIYAKARQDYVERERRKTPSEHAEREEARRDVRRFTDDLVNSFSPMTIINHLDAATEEFSAATQRGGLTYEQLRQIEEAHERWVAVLEFGRQMAGGVE
jgi:hypothetical protein